MVIKKAHFQPRSLTWWSGFVPLAAGLVLASEPLHGWAAVSEAIKLAAGPVPPSALIMYGLTAIGLRGALP